MNHEEANLSEEQLALKRDFIARRGYWASAWEDVLRLTPEFFSAYLELSAIPWDSGPLDPKIKELIYIALDANPTHMFSPGLRIHIRNAFGHGATPEEIIEVLQLATAAGIHGYTLGIPMLQEEIQRISGEEHGQGRDG